MSDCSDNEDQCTPPEICKIADDVALDLLPEKSKKVYEKCYNNFIEWKKSNNVNSCSERVMMAYIKKLATDNKYSAATLWSYFSMLKTTIKVNDKINITDYHSVIAFLKKQSRGYVSKKSNVFSTEQINRFLTEAPDDIHLLTKVSLIFGVAGACCKEELVKITMEDIETHGELLLVKIPVTKTAKPRSFTISDTFCSVVKKYMMLRPADIQTSRFFINYRNGKCTEQVVGKNKFGLMPKEIATYLDLPEPGTYTGHCFRRTSATVLADSGANMTTLKRHGGWRSSTVAEGYIEESIKNKSKIGNIITSAINLPRSSTDSEDIEDEEPPAKQTKNTLLRDIENLLNDEETKDVSFVFSNEEKIKAHRAILIARSTRFRQIFRDATVTEVRISNVQPEVFKLMLEYIYKNSISNELRLKELQTLAEDYQITELVNWCTKKMQDITFFRMLPSRPAFI